MSQLTWENKVFSTDTSNPQVIEMQNDILTLQMHQIERFPTCYESIHLSLNKITPLYKPVISIIPKMTELRKIEIESLNDAPLQDVEELFDTLKEPTIAPLLQELNLKVNSKYAQLIFNCSSAARITSLSLIIDDQNETSLKELFNSLQKCQSLTSLKITFHIEPVTQNQLYTINQNFDHFGKSIFLFKTLISDCDFMALPSLSKLSLDFPQNIIPTISELAGIAKNLSQFSTLKDLSINIKSNSIDRKAFEMLLTNLSHECKFKLKHLSLSLPIDFEEHIASLLRRFVEISSEELESISFACMRYTSCVYNQLKQMHEKLHKLTRIDYSQKLMFAILKLESFENPFPEILMQSRVTLEHVELVLNSANYFPEESIMQLGKALTLIEQLKNLRLQIKGQFSETTMFSLSEQITSCEHLRSLSLQLSDINGTISIEKESDQQSDDSSKSIYENDSITIPSNSKGAFCIVIELLIAIKTRNASKLYLNIQEFSQFSVSQIRKVISLIEEFIKVEHRFRSIVLQVDEVQHWKVIQKFMVQLINQNTSTLEFVEFTGTVFNDRMLKALIPAGPNLLRLAIFNSISLKFNHNLKELFPNLISFETPITNQLIDNPFEVKPTDFVNSNLTELCPFFHNLRPLERYKPRYEYFQQIIPLTQCKYDRKRTILIFATFNKYISKYLIFKPHFMQLDLYLDDEQTITYPTE